MARPRTSTTSARKRDVSATDAAGSAIAPKEISFRSARTPAAENIAHTTMEIFMLVFIFKLFFSPEPLPLIVMFLFSYYLIYINF